MAGSKAPIIVSSSGGGTPDLPGANALTPFFIAITDGDGQMVTNWMQGCCGCCSAGERQIYSITNIICSKVQRAEHGRLDAEVLRMLSS